jgi:hypothetical protein
MSYYVFTIHKGYVAFRCEDGRTGSDPGTAAELLIERFKTRFKIAEGEYEILDARVMQGDFVYTMRDSVMP